jgi:AraC family transcriptional regulator
MNPHGYLIGRRVKRAKDLMLQSDAPLSEIALAAGFSDQAHFTTRFRRVVGITPGAWRRERREATLGDRPIALAGCVRATAAAPV